MLPAANLLRALSRGMREVAVSLPEGVPSAALARVRLEAGIPALVGEPLLDSGALLHAAQHIARELAESGNESGSQALAYIETALTGPGADEIVSGSIAGAWEEIRAAMRLASESDEDATITLLDYATRPTLRAAAERAGDVIGDARWTRGSCPCCGAQPLLAELRAPSSGGERERFLRCGRCATGWAYPRVGCPGCGTTDHRALHYLHVDGEEEFRRAMTCDRCHTYIKEIAALDPLDADTLLEEDLATVGLDLVAVARGYRRTGAD